MYKDYFGLSDLPFSIAPDPNYLYLSEKHREALAHMIYGVGDQGGFVVLTGEVGTGKTTICRSVLQQLPDNANIAFVINPRQSINQLLQSVFSELSIPYREGMTSKDMMDRLNAYLLGAHADGRNTILIIDEAQNLSVDVLEQLRLLTNLETDEKKLLQLVLLGQPELNELLAKPELRQLTQRVTARYHLIPLSKKEVADYIDHRLSVAKCTSNVFTPAAMTSVYKFSGGVPRLINILCDRAMLGVYSQSGDFVHKAHISKAAKEIFSEYKVKPAFPISIVAATVVAVLLLLGTYLIKNEYVQIQLGNNAAQLSTVPSSANDSVEAL